jgi:hypothetical protein
MGNGLLSIKQLQKMLEEEAMGRTQRSTRSLENALFRDREYHPKDNATVEKLAEAFASQLHPRLDSAGYAHPQWKAAYTQFMANYRKQKAMKEQESYTTTTLGELMDEENRRPLVDTSKGMNSSITDSSLPGMYSSSVPASIREVFAVFVDDLGQPALKHIFNNESDANTYAKGLGFVKKISLLTNLDTLSEVEKMEMRDRNK